MPILRSVSLIVALTVSVTLMLFPFLLRHVNGASLHAALPILMLGVTGSIVKGVGYTPDNKVLRVMFGTTCSLALIALGAYLLIRY